jgi:hypothetical protein
MAMFTHLTSGHGWGFDVPSYRYSPLRYMPVTPRFPLQHHRLMAQDTTA